MKTNAPVIISENNGRILFGSYFALPTDTIASNRIATYIGNLNTDSYSFDQSYNNMATVTRQLIDIGTNERVRMVMLNDTNISESEAFKMCFNDEYNYYRSLTPRERRLYRSCELNEYLPIFL